ncbi:hypothetical protein UA08_08802 [Talaromyces atroroseus]|uniref:Rhodopsin domain-containing protein n=1 Tax=Talaromyces atroroseus TaxID=1441469 RepID=A0A225AK59_TALAT|nr:hypothetical protein UA08_08802 [Talaromyces atroroseus]OKL55909.1 hypothetical protein UA08_08802 [Talaromyces atroroseus]
MVKIYPIDSFGRVYHEVIASGCLVSVASVALFMRLTARWSKKIPLWWDDFTIIAVWILLWAILAIQIKYAQYGMGDQMTTIPPGNVVLMLKILPGFQVLWGTAMSLAKFSYMFFYLSVFKVSNNFRLLTFGCLLITIISIIRMKSLVVLSFTEISSSMVDPVFWTVVEPSLAVTNACLPIIRPILAVVIPGHLFSSAYKTPKSDDVRGFGNIEDGTYPLSPLNAGSSTSHIRSDQKQSTAAAASVETDDDSQRRVSNENTGPLGRITRTTEWEVKH